MKPNLNIFQICINLNDNHPKLKSCQSELIKKNSRYQYHYIKSEELMHDMMKDAFADSHEPFDRQVYESFLLVDGKLGGGLKCSKIDDPKEKEEQYKINVLVSRTDIFRYAMLYKYGGLYADISSAVSVDIDNDISEYNFYAVKSQREVRSSFLYGKQGNTICRLVLESITASCNKETRDKSLNQYRYAGPRCLGEVLISESSSKKTSDWHESLKLINIDHHNGKVEDESSCSFFFMDASWKKSLHMPDKDNPNTKINSHWLFDY
jgi:mannosyltransferase OCH1-like enzyme